MKNYWQFIKENEEVQDESDEEVDEEVQDDESDEEDSEDEVERKFRDILQNETIADLFNNWLGASNIFYYVDDEKFIEDYIDSQVDSSTESKAEFSSMMSIEEMQKILKNHEDLEYLQKWKKDKLRKELDDDEEYEWEVDIMMDQSFDEIIDDIDDRADLAELIYDFGVERECAEEHHDGEFKYAEDVVLEYCSKNDIECILSHVEDYLDVDQIIDVIVNDTDYYTMRDIVR